MKLGFDNYKEYVPEKDHKYIYGLLYDLEDLNNKLVELDGFGQIYIDIQDWHDEYSPERTDPCPDYYGMYRLYNINNPNESIGIEMNIHQLDIILCTLINFVESKKL